MPKAKKRELMAGDDSAVRQIQKYVEIRGVERISRSDVAALARRYGPKAVQILNRIMSNKKVKPQHRIAAAKEILNRGYGTPTIHVSPESYSDGDLEHVVRQILAKRQKETLELAEPEIVPAILEGEDDES